MKKLVPILQKFLYKEENLSHLIFDASRYRGKRSGFTRSSLAETGEILSNISGLKNNRYSHGFIFVVVDVMVVDVLTEEKIEQINIAE
jgi:hypothetical protein